MYISIPHLFSDHVLPILPIKFLVFSAILGAAYAFDYYKHNREHIARMDVLEKQLVQAKLDALKSQLHPHFLFNTLSNVLSLLDTHPNKGKSMLVDFIQYLLASLSKIREEKATLGQEMEMILAYLGIFKVRMGHRLKYKIDLPEHLEATSFPPMLIQPLVENAIKHGLEPKVDGGEILIRGIEKDGILRLEIVDSGMGFNAEREAGMGLSNYVPLTERE